MTKIKSPYHNNATRSTSGTDDKGSVQTYRREFMGKATWKDSVGQQQERTRLASHTLMCTGSCHLQSKHLWFLGHFTQTLSGAPRQGQRSIGVCAEPSTTVTHSSVLGDMSFLRHSFWRALWENNDLGCLCQNKPPFLSRALDRSALWPLSCRATKHPLLLSQAAFLSPHVTIKCVCKLEKVGTSHIIYLLSEYMSRKYINMHLWHGKTLRCLFAVMYVLIKILSIPKSPKYCAGREPLRCVIYCVFGSPCFNLKNVAVTHTDLMFLSSCFYVQTLCGSDGCFNTVYLSTASPLLEMWTLHEDCGSHSFNAYF